LHYEVTITNEFTNAVPTIDECFQIISDLKLNAAPGPDGLNVVFYRAACHGSKMDVHKLIRLLHLDQIPYATNNEDRMEGTVINYVENTYCE